MIRFIVKEVYVGHVVHDCVRELIGAELIDTDQDPTKEER